jgi:hypothetical protein
VLLATSVFRGSIYDKSPTAGDCHAPFPSGEMHSRVEAMSAEEIETRTNPVSKFNNRREQRIDGDGGFGGYEKGREKR